MTDRDRLKELHNEAGAEWDYYLDECLNNGEMPSKTYDEFCADHLLANGVIVPPCKVGQVVWVISHWYKYMEPEIESRKILSVQIYKNGNIQYHYKDGCFWKDHIGKTVFLSKEEAEQALKEREGQ